MGAGVTAARRPHHRRPGGYCRNCELPPSCAGGTIPSEGRASTNEALWDADVSLFLSAEQRAPGDEFRVDKVEIARRADPIRRVSKFTLAGVDTLSVVAFACANLNSRDI